MKASCSGPLPTHDGPERMTKRPILVYFVPFVPVLIQRVKRSSALVPVYGRAATLRILRNATSITMVRLNYLLQLTDTDTGNFIHLVSPRLSNVFVTDRALGACLGSRESTGTSRPSEFS